VEDEAEPNSALSATNQLLFLAPENIKSLDCIFDCRREGAAGEEESS
jgi:hypothetical protein